MRSLYHARTPQRPQRRRDSPPPASGRPFLSSQPPTPGPGRAGRGNNLFGTGRNRGNANGENGGIKPARHAAAVRGRGAWGRRAPAPPTMGRTVNRITSSNRPINRRGQDHGPAHGHGGCGVRVAPARQPAGRSTRSTNPRTSTYSIAITHASGSQAQRSGLALSRTVCYSDTSECHGESAEPAVLRCEADGAQTADRRYAAEWRWLPETSWLPSVIARCC